MRPEDCVVEVRELTDGEVKEEGEGEDEEMEETPSLGQVGGARGSLATRYKPILRHIMQK